MSMHACTVAAYFILIDIVKRCLYQAMICAQYAIATCEVVLKYTSIYAVQNRQI